MFPEFPVKQKGNAFTKKFKKGSKKWQKKYKKIH
jgi:hypothetical protein